MDRYGHILQEHRHKSALSVAQILGEPPETQEPSETATTETTDQDDSPKQ